MKIAGFKGGEPRHPLKPLSDEAKERIREEMEEEGFK
jgi:hypothetical protein